MRADERLKTLVLSVKAWARRRGINNRGQGTMSSFALTLMLIHFLQHREVPVLPSLQDLAIARRYPPVYLQGTDCRYCSCPDEIAAELQRLQGQHGPNTEPLGLLLFEFFHHFGYRYQNGTIAIRDRSSLLPRSDEAQSFLVVDNPFEPGKDVANVEVKLYTRLREEFRRVDARACCCCHG
ncbi:unnamed protein product [Polarella glacialis]|uniref:PAP-associated domain-containing protein n=1 Tax=Polarella glacialis TaxID=89957 RepID=A0A813LM64_POLGL|nr:unnamed protein product [Polarella glacialis]